MKRLNVGLLGLGTVGTGVVKVLAENGKRIARKSGVDIRLAAIGDKDTRRRPGLSLQRGLLSSEVARVLDAPDVDVVVELIGGIRPAKDFTLRALANGKDVVTANKALLATHGSELFQAAREHGRCIAFEASTAGAIPIVAALRDGLAANEIETIVGIVNGTCNYVLSKMARDGISYDEALREAQELGYAEADPTLDVEGIDSAHKLAIMARLAWALDFPFDAIQCEGISHVQLDDIQHAAELGYTLKLLVIAKRHRGSLELRVSPSLLPEDHPLAAVHGVFNAVCVRGDASDETMHYGRGAGQMPTASAVVADLIDVGLGRAGITFANVEPFRRPCRQAKLLDPDRTQCRYYLSFLALDRPGVLAKIAGLLGKHRISIASVIQRDRLEGKHVRVAMMTHAAQEGNLRRALEEIDGLDVIRGESRFLRVEGVED